MRQIKFCDRSMKKHFILVAVIGVLIAVGCSSPYSENIDEPIREDNKKAKEVIITATFDNQSDAQTKTVLNAEGKVEWLPADEIVIFSDGESAKFTSINTENARKANFRGTISFVTGATEGSDPDAFVYGLYPYDANATATGGIITTTIPTAQVGLAGSFADDLALAVAKSVSTNLSFKNAYSGIDFEFSEEGYETVTLSSNNGEPIAGAVTISFGSDGVPVTTVDANGSSSITLTAPGGGTFETEKRYYILCAPQTLNGGYTLTAEKSTGRAVFERTSKKEFKRNVLTDVSGYLNERATFVESSNITFADSKVKEICVDPATGWDTNHDGELSYTEAAAVTDIGTVFKSTEITSFDELKYFTGISSITNAFSDCNLLTSLSLPSQLTSISGLNFQNTTSLNRIVVPSIDFWMDVVCGCRPFNSSKSGDLYVNDNLITEFIIPDGRTTLPQYMCSYLTKIDAVAFEDDEVVPGHITIPEGVTTIGERAFEGCELLKSISLPKSLVSGERALCASCVEDIECYTNYLHVYGTASGKLTRTFLSRLLDGDVYFNNDDGSACGDATRHAIKSIMVQNAESETYILPDYAFASYYSLASLSLPEGLTSIGDRAFAYCKNMSLLELPASVEAIGDNAFDGCNTLTKMCLPSIGMWLNVVCTSCPFLSSGSGDLYINDNLITTFTVPSDWVGIPKGLCCGLNKLQELNIPAGVTSIGEYAFYGCAGLSDLVIPSGVTTIGQYAFYGCSGLSDLDIPSGVTSIEQYAFYHCSGVTSFILPEGVTTIGESSFCGCTSLTSIIIPSGVTLIGENAFTYCIGLTDIIMKPTTPPVLEPSSQWATIGFPFERTNNCPIYVPSASVDAYKNAKVWKEHYKNRIQAMLEVAVTGVSFDIATLTLDANTSTTLVPIVAPENATDKTVTWTSSNPDAVTVDQSGTITAQNGGSSMITVTTTDGGYSASCVVTVKPNDIHFNPESYIVYRKNQYMLDQSASTGYYTFESHFDPFAAGQKVEFKFQVVSDFPYYQYSPLAGLDYSISDLALNGSSYFNFRANGVNKNDVMTVTIDLAADNIIVNGKAGTGAPSLQNEGDRYFFSYYEEYSDSGRYHDWQGTEEGTKIYYIVVRDSDNVIIQEGYPDRAVNPETGNTEYCWCWRAADGTKTYNFANAAGTYGAYEGYIP